MILRDYQEAAIESVYNHLRKRIDNPCVVIPTGGGKTPIIAQIVKDAIGKWDGRVIIVSHVKELLEQNLEKLLLMAPELTGKVGLHCAGLGRRDVDEPVIIASIQSVVRHACDIGPRNLILVDEAHLIPPAGDGLYQTFLKEMQVINPHVRVIGLTATPYRTTSGKICNPDTILNRVCYEVGVRELIDRGFLCPLRSKGGKKKVDCSGLHSRAGEFIASEVEALMTDEEIIQAAVEEILEYGEARKKALVFCSGLKHMNEVAQALIWQGSNDIVVRQIDGKTPKKQRAEILDAFKKGYINYLCNVGVLTTGFDAPDVDMVALLRPTKSPGLYYQMVGRGFRIAPGKENCLILDYGQNVRRHGPVDQIRAKDKRFCTNEQGQTVLQDEAGSVPVYECERCHELIEYPFPEECPACGAPIPKDEVRHAPEAATDEIVSSGKIKFEKVEVRGVDYTIHQKSSDRPATLRVIYRLGFGNILSEFLCFDHPPGSWPRSKAESWWRRRSHTSPPDSVEHACDLAEQGALAETVSLRVKTDPAQEWPEIVGCELGDKPEGFVSDGYCPY